MHRSLNELTLLRLRLRPHWLLAAALVIGFGLVAHGCHGPDEDHELFAQLTAR